MYRPNNATKVRELLSKKFVLCGRVFVPFAIKDGKVYFVETDEDFDRAPHDEQCDQFRLSYIQFIEWYNPLELNKDQVSIMSISLRAAHSVCRISANMSPGSISDCPLRFPSWNFCLAILLISMTSVRLRLYDSLPFH